MTKISHILITLSPCKGVWKLKYSANTHTHTHNIGSERECISDGDISIYFELCMTAALRPNVG